MTDADRRCRRCGSPVTEGLVATSPPLLSDADCCASVPDVAGLGVGDCRHTVTTVSPSGGGVCPEHGALAPSEVDEDG